MLLMKGVNLTIIVINCHPYLFILIIFIYLILHMAWENHYFICEIEIELPTQTFRRTETRQCCPVTFINKIAWVQDRYIYINQQRGGKMTV